MPPPKCPKCEATLECKCGLCRYDTKLWAECTCGMCRTRLKDGKNRGVRTKEGLDPEDQKRVLEEARRYFTESTVGGPGALENLRDGDAALTNERLYQTVYMMMCGGMHRRVIVEPERQGLKFMPPNKLFWKRPKKVGHDAKLAIPLPQDAVEWAPGFVEWLTKRKGIGRRVLAALLHELGKRAKVPGRMSPLSMRHTAGQNLARRGISETIIADYLNCTLEVARGYSRATGKQVEKALEAANALKAPGEE